MDRPCHAVGPRPRALSPMRLPPHSSLTRCRSARSSHQGSHSCPGWGGRFPHSCSHTQNWAKVLSRQTGGLRISQSLAPALDPTQRRGHMNPWPCRSHAGERETKCHQMGRGPQVGSCAQPQTLSRLSSKPLASLSLGKQGHSQEDFMPKTAGLGSSQAQGVLAQKPGTGPSLTMALPAACVRPCLQPLPLSPGAVGLGREGQLVLSTAMCRGGPPEGQVVSPGPLAAQGWAEYEGH